MSYEIVILVLILLIFCFFMQILTIKVMLSMFNASRKDGEREIKPVKLIEKRKRKSPAQRKADEEAKKAQREFEIELRNLEAFDGSSFGQEDIE